MFVARRGTRTRLPVLTNPAIARLGEHGPHLYAFLYAFGLAYPYNFLDMAAPVSRVSSPLRCEYRSVDAADLCPR